MSTALAAAAQGGGSLAISVFSNRIRSFSHASLFLLVFFFGLTPWQLDSLATSLVFAPA
jgi:hypothetical protein